MSKRKLTQTQIDQAKYLDSIGIPRTRIAKYYSVTLPAIIYHLNQSPLKKQSIDQMLKEV